MARMGINRADYIAGYFEKSAGEQNRCIFLSHASIDKVAVKEIGKYIMKSGIDIYLDENDVDLQAAADSGNHEAVTTCIEKGISNSTDIFCIVSEATKESWWVPYEVGYGKRANVELYTFILKDVNHIPSYLEICSTIKDIYDLNRTLGRLSKGLLKEGSILQHRYSDEGGLFLPYNTKDHPLRDYVRGMRI